MKTNKAKLLISLRMEPNLLAWFRAQCPNGYQTLMHSVLSSYMQNQTEKQIRAAGQAQEIFRRYHSQCFWHYHSNLEITPNNIDIVIQGLKKYGGREGLILAEKLCH